VKLFIQTKFRRKFGTTERTSALSARSLEGVGDAFPYFSYFAKPQGIEKYPTLESQMERYRTGGLTEVEVFPLRLT
jgi:hypothetical protein